MLYRHTGLVLVRASTNPDRFDLPDDIDTGNARTWLTDLWRREEIRTALRIASPALCRQVDAAITGGVTDERQLRRMVVSVASYLLRWQHRPTPFGLFAGVASASVGEPAARFGRDDRAVLRADAEWLSRLIDGLEQNPALLPRLPVVVNNSGFVRGNRFVVPDPSSYAVPDRYREIAVSRTRPVRAALAAAASPLRFGELAARVAEAFPEAPRHRIDALLAELVTSRVLLTSLRAAMTTADALVHLIEQLEDLDAEDLPDLAELLKELTATHAELVHGGHTFGSIDALTERMTKVVGTDHVVAVDVQLDCQVSIPGAVIREAEAAATTLLRLTPNPFGSSAWKDFHVRFRDRYGPGALVPVRDVVADSGLGFPTGFLGAPRRQPARPLTERDERLLALVQQAGLDGEIDLTSAVIRDLAVGDHAEMIPPPRAELAFQLRTVSPAALARGQFELWVTGAPRPASSMAGRFAHLLSETDQRRLVTTFASPAAGPVVAQLSFPPRRTRNENITRTPQLLPYTISLAEHGTGGIDLDDLAVTADATRLYLMRMSTGVQVQPYVLHALEASVHTPPLARFLAEVATARCGEYGPIDFGAASRLPHLPRVRSGRSILSPARWLLTTNDLSPHEWENSLSRWRDRWHVPPAVVLCQAELRLPIQLDHPLHRALLRTRLERAGRVELREDSTTGWPDRPCEFLVSMSAVTNDSSRLPVTAKPAEPLLPGRAAFLHAQLLGHPARFDEILTDHLPRFISDIADHVQASWFRRDHDTTRPESAHFIGLCLRLHVLSDYGLTAGQLAGWFGRLSGLGLVADLNLTPYRPQHGRYGDRAMRAAEGVFAADSTAALAELTMAARAGIPTDAIAAVSLAELAASFAVTPHDGWQGLTELLPHEHGKLDRSLRAATLALVKRAAVPVHAGGQQVTAAWDQRRAALAEYRDLLAQERDPRMVLRSLLHDHYVRVIGVDPDRERVVNRLARTVALHQLAVTS